MGSEGTQGPPLQGTMDRLPFLGEALHKQAQGGRERNCGHINLPSPGGRRRVDHRINGEERNAPKDQVGNSSKGHMEE